MNLALSLVLTWHLAVPVVVPSPCCPVMTWVAARVIAVVPPPAPPPPAPRQWSA